MPKYFVHTKESIAKRIKQGRGMGTGSEYKPWLTVHDFPSNSRVHRIWDPRLNRMRDLLSDLEEKVYYFYWWSSKITQIREQFPLLPQEETISIAQEFGLEHPRDPKTKYPTVMTTDFFLDCESLTGKVHYARTVKPASQLKNPNVIGKFEIERIYWEHRGINWKIVTEADIPFNTTFNVKWIYPCYSETGVGKIDYGLIEEARLRMLKGSSGDHFPFRALVRECDKYFNFVPTTSINIVRHLIARRVWRFDMSQRIWRAKVLKFL